MSRDPINRAPVVNTGTVDIVLLPAGKFPGVGDERQVRDAVAMVNALRHLHRNLVILAEHDPNAASLLTAEHSRVVQP